MLVKGCHLSAVDCQGLGIAIEHRNIAMKWQVSAVPKKPMVIF